MLTLRRRTMLGLVYPALASLGAAACSYAYGHDGSLGEEQEPLTVTQTFRDGFSGYNGTADTYVAQKTPTSNYGSATACHLDGDDARNDEDKSCLLRWALSGVPTDARVTSASITLRVLDAGDTYQLYALNRSFNEAEATWNHAASGSAWGSEGARAATDRGPEIGSLSGSSGSKTIKLNAAGIAMVQGWVDGTNHGIVIANPNPKTNRNGGSELASSEHGTSSYRPQLSITYTTSAGSGMPALRR
jgi:hypothetical protein